VYRHQVDACARAGPALLAGSESPHAALARWIDLFVDFLASAATGVTTPAAWPGC
jgi:hypothetical protein